MTEDPFGAQTLRGHVLAGWAASPARFREDANAEEDQALGGYRDRLVVELAQNATDAAVRAGVPGRLLLAVHEGGGGPTLVAANTGAPLDAHGVEGLATLRASAKRDGAQTVGRFGVGFSAVLTVTDEPAVLSRTGGVRFSRGDTRALVEDMPGLHEELVRRDGHVPVLRLPFATEGAPPDGYDTAVLMPLRDAAAVELVHHLLADVADPLLLALPGLSEIVVRRPGVPDLVVRDVAERWHVVTAAGRLDAAQLADRPTEERVRTSWQVTWALPREPEEDGAWRTGVVHAPTPSDEPLPWRALLVATFPLDPSRRHVAPGPATDAVVAGAAAAYTGLVAARAADGEPVWDLVPTGLPSGGIDSALREAVLEALPDVAFLVSAEYPDQLVRPREAMAIELPAGGDPDVVAALAPTFAGLVAAPRRASTALVALGVRRTPLADVVESLPAVPEPEHWHHLYAALAPLADDPLAREALAGVPVPLADGRVVRGVRGVVVLPAGGEETVHEVAPALAPLGVRVADPAAAHPLLVRLGADDATARSLLVSPPVRAAVEAIGHASGTFGTDDPDDPEALTEAVLRLVAAAVAAGELSAGELTWLGDLELPDEDGEPAPASSLCLAGSLAARLFSRDDLGLVDDDTTARWGAATLAAVGALAVPAVLRVADVPLEPGDGGTGDADPGALLDGWDDWTAAALEAWFAAADGAGDEDVVVSEVVAVRDLDALQEGALPEFVEWLAGDRSARRALLDPALLVGGGRRVAFTPYTAWWLRRRLTGGGVLLDPDGDPALAGLLDPAPDWTASHDLPVRQALGAVLDVEGLDAPSIGPVLEHLADPHRTLDAATLLSVVRRLAVLVTEGAELPADPPPLVRVPDAGTTRVVPASGVIVADSPMYRQRPDLGVPLFVPPALAPAVADLLDLPLAGDLVGGDLGGGDLGGGDLAAGGIGGPGVASPVPEEVLRLLPGAPSHWWEHDRLHVDGVEVDWWVLGPPGDPQVHASTVDGLARALAWASDRWELRSAVALVLADPTAAADLALDEAFTSR